MNPLTFPSLVAFADARLGLKWLFVRKRRRTVACHAHQLSKILRACPRFRRGLYTRVEECSECPDCDW